MLETIIDSQISEEGIQVLYLYLIENNQTLVDITMVRMAEMNPKFEILSVENLELDSENPRIAKWMIMYKEPTIAEQLSLALRDLS